MFKQALLTAAVSSALSVPAFAQQDQSDSSSQDLAQQSQQSQQSQSQGQSSQQPGSQNQASSQSGSQQSQSQASGGQSQGQDLQQMAQNQPEQLVGKRVQSPEGEELGKVLEILESKNDGDLYAAVRPQDEEDISVIPLQALQLDKLMLLGSSQERQPYEVADYQAISSNSSGQQQGGQSQQQSQSSQQQAGQSQQGQSLEQMARNQPEQLTGSKLQSSEGDQLGEIAEIVESRTGGQIFAVVRPADEGDMQEEIVPLSELQMEDVLVLTGAEDLQRSEYQAFESVDVSTQEPA